MRSLSRELDDHPLNVEEGKKYIFKNTVWAALYIVWFALTVASTVPWLWLMSINAHWFSTMYSWYTFASTFVAGVALMTLFVIYLKNKGYLEYVNRNTCMTWVNSNLPFQSSGPISGFRSSC